MGGRHSVSHPRRMSRLTTTVVAATLALGTVGTVSAHGAVGTDFQTPLPLDLLLVGAGATVALTALLLAVAGEFPAPQRTLARVPARQVARIRTGVRVVFLLVVAGAVLAGLTGRQVAAENAATVFVWPVWLKGLALVAVIAGSFWQTLSPWRTLYDGLCRLEGESLRARQYPDWLGAWPALVAFLLLVGIVENLTTVVRDPARTAGLVAALTALMIVGALSFGEEWLEKADPLAVFYRLLARTAPLQVSREVTIADGGTDDRGITETGAVALSVRVPWRATARPVTDWALVVFVVATVYTVSFDGFVETPGYQQLLFGTRELVGSGPATPALLYLLGLAGFVVVFVLTARLAGRLGAGRDIARAFVPTVVPIAAAYEIAHNYPFVLRNLGRLPGTVGLETVNPLAALSLPLFWASQVVLIVLGHVVAVVAAHRVATTLAQSRRQALLAHAPLVVLMVGYTILSLWVVSQPVVG